MHMRMHVPAYGTTLLRLLDCASTCVNTCVWTYAQMYVRTGMPAGAFITCLCKCVHVHMSTRASQHVPMHHERCRNERNRRLYIGIADGMSIARVWACWYSK